jgi:hypothetical protein
MSDTWRFVVVVLGAGLLIEAVLLVGVMRQLGELLLHGAPARTSVPAGPKIGTVVEVPGREQTRRPLLVVFTSATCERCKAIAPGLQRMNAIYGVHGEDGHQLDVIAVLTDRDANGRAEYARELGSFARMDLIALMQDWNVPGTPFAVALDDNLRVKAAEVVNTRLQLEMLAVQKLGIVWRASPEATVDAASFAIQHVGSGGPNPTEVLP